MNVFFEQVSLQTCFDRVGYVLAFPTRFRAQSVSTEHDSFPYGQSIDLSEFKIWKCAHAHPDLLEQYQPQQTRKQIPTPPHLKQYSVSISYLSLVGYFCLFLTMSQCLTPPPLRDENWYVPDMDA